MSSPKANQSSLKANLWPAIFWNILITATVFFLVPAILYSSPVFGDTAEIVRTLLLSAAYAYLYTRASFNWRADPAAGFFNAPWMISAAATSKVPWLRIGNSLLFSLLTTVVIIMSLYLAGMMVVNLYGFILEGIRGAVPPTDTSSSSATMIQIGIAGFGMELVGKTEDQPR
jgi:hypothetical protein